MLLKYYQPLIQAHMGSTRLEHESPAKAGPYSGHLPYSKYNNHRLTLNDNTGTKVAVAAAAFGCQPHDNQLPICSYEMIEDPGDVLGLISNN